MTWKKAVLLLTVVIAVILSIVSVRPSNLAELRESVDLQFASSAKLQFERSFPLRGLALSGSWEGPGSAQVWLVGEGKKYLILDTRSVPEVLEFSSFGTRFESSCYESCEIPSLNSEFLVVVLSGPGVLNIDSLHFAVPLDPTGLASCPQCKKIQQSDTPDHSLLTLVLMLVIAVIGAHSLGHYCKNPATKKVLVLIFLGAFIALGGVFGTAVATPTGAVAVVAKQAASVVAALAVIILFMITAAEAVRHKPVDPPKQDVWKELEEVEEKWEK